MLIGKRLKELRKARGLSQTELGNMINVTKVSVCGYESENRTPNLETFQDLTRVLEVSADYLLGNDIKVVSESEQSYQVMMAKEGIEFMTLLKKNKELYQKLLEDPKRLVELMDKKINYKG